MINIDAPLSPEELKAADSNNQSTTDLQAEFITLLGRARRPAPGGYHIADWCPKLIDPAVEYKLPAQLAAARRQFGFVGEKALRLRWNAWLRELAAIPSADRWALLPRTHVGTASAPATYDPRPLFAQVQAAGATLSVTADGGLVAIPAGVLTTQLKKLLSDHKSAIIQALRQGEVIP